MFRFALVLFIPLFAPTAKAALVLQLCEIELRALGIRQAKAPALLPAKTSEAVTEITNVIDGLLERAKRANKPLVLATAQSECNECSGKLQSALVPLGYSVQRFMVDTMGEFPAKAARVVREDGTSMPFKAEKGVGLFYHVFLAFPARGSRQTILVDPTYLQFFDPEFAKTQKPVFVGTEAELLAYFKENRAHTRVQTYHDPNTRTILAIEDTDLWVRSMYGMDGGLSDRTLENVPGTAPARN